MWRTFLPLGLCFKSLKRVEPRPHLKGSSQRSVGLDATHHRGAPRRRASRSCKVLRGARRFFRLAAAAEVGYNRHSARDRQRLTHCLGQNGLKAHDAYE